MINENDKSNMPEKESGADQKKREENDHSVRESIETVTPDTENPLPGPDAESSENKSEK